MLVHTGPLPDAPVEAAAQYYRVCLPRVLEALAAGENAVVVFPSADHTHRAWRLAAMQGLARENAPLRVNGVASDDASAIAAAEAYLEDAEAITGQYFALDTAGAGDPLT